MEILVKDDILKEVDGTVVRGLVLIQNYSLLPQKNGGQYINGYLQAKGQVAFKIWSDSSPNSAFQRLSTNPIKNKICSVSGKVNIFGGMTSLVLTDVNEVPTDVTEKLGISEASFMEDVYDVDELWNKMFAVLKKNCSDTAVKVFTQVLSPLKGRFETEFAAIHHHDNCKNGLLAHTTKVLRLATLIKMYPSLLERVSPDVLFIGCALHDIGKVFEYDSGVISDTGRMLSHHTFGVMHLLEYRDLIISSMGESFFYSMLSIVEQHHGEFEERPRTIAAYVIHKIDTLDSVFTTLDAMIAISKPDEQLQYDGYKLI